MQSEVSANKQLDLGRKVTAASGPKASGPPTSRSRVAASSSTRVAKSTVSSSVNKTVNWLSVKLPFSDKMPDRINLTILLLVLLPLIHDSWTGITRLGEEGVVGAGEAGVGEEVVVPSIISRWSSAWNFGERKQ